MPGPATGYYSWDRPSPRWRARWRQRVEMPLQECSFQDGKFNDFVRWCEYQDTHHKDAFIRKAWTMSSIFTLNNEYK